MIPLMNLTRQYQGLEKELDEAALRVLHSGQYILGDEVFGFEKEFAAYCGVKYAVGVGNGTDALVLALLAAGVGAGDEVITFAPYFGEYRSYVSNFDGILNAVPANTVDFQPNQEVFETMITPKTKAVIVNTHNNPT